MCVYLCKCVHVCTCVYVYTCVCMGCGAGEKHLLFSAELCYGLDPAYQGKLLSITDLNCLPGVSYTLVFVQMPAGFNQFRRLEVRRSPFFGRTLIPIRIVACHLRDLPVEWLVSLWQTWLVVSFEGLMQSWPHKRQIALGSWAMKLAQRRVKIERVLEIKSCDRKNWSCLIQRKRRSGDRRPI